MEGLPDSKAHASPCFASRTSTGRLLSPPSKTAASPEAAGIAVRARTAPLRRSTSELQLGTPGSRGPRATEVARSGPLPQGPGGGTSWPSSDAEDDEAGLSATLEAEIRALELTAQGDGRCPAARAPGARRRWPRQPRPHGPGPDGAQPRASGAPASPGARAGDSDAELQEIEDDVGRLEARLEWWRQQSQALHSDGGSEHGFGTAADTGKDVPACRGTALDELQGDGLASCAEWLDCPHWSAARLEQPALAVARDEPLRQRHEPAGKAPPAALEGGLWSGSCPLSELVTRQAAELLGAHEEPFSFTPPPRAARPEQQLLTPPPGVAPVDGLLAPAGCAAQHVGDGAVERGCAAAASQASAADEEAPAADGGIQVLGFDELFNL